MSWQEERRLWWFGAALLGGRTTLWMFVPTVVSAIAAMLYLLLRDVDTSLRHMLVLVLVKIGAATCFLAIPIAAAQLRAQTNLHPLLHLTPGTKQRLRALFWRLALLAAICFVPALVLDVFFSLADRADPGSPITLRSAEPYIWRGWALYLLASAGVIYLVASQVRVPFNFIWIPVNSAAYQSTLKHWWIPLAMCLVFIGLPWLYQRLTGEAPKRMRMLDENVYLVVASPPSRFDDWRERWRAWRLRRLLEAVPQRGALALAILSQECSFVYNWMGTLTFAFALTFVPLSWLANGKIGYLLLSMLLLPLVLPQPMRIASLWLLPLGRRRPPLGDLLVSVWMHRVRSRLAVAVVLGFLLTMVREALLPGWGIPTDHSDVSGSALVRFIFGPLLFTASLYGTAYVIVAALASLWLRLYRSSTANALIFLSMLLAPIVQVGGMWAADAIALRLGFEAPSFVGYAFMCGVALPILARVTLRAQRRRWASVDIATVSDRFEEWQRQLDRASPFAQMTPVTRRADGAYVVQRQA